MQHLGEAVHRLLVGRGEVQADAVVDVVTFGSRDLPTLIRWVILKLSYPFDDPLYMLETKVGLATTRQIITLLLRIESVCLSMHRGPYI